MISGLMASIPGFPDSGTLPEGPGQPARPGACFASQPAGPASQTGVTWLAGPAESIHLVKSSFSPVPSLGQIGFQPSHLT